MLFFLNIIIFFLGLAIGSFLNAVIYRLKHGGSIWFGRSKCPHCKKTLGFWDLIPVLSFIFLRGKCRYCKKKISWQYLAIEIITALLFLLVFNFQFLIFNFQSIFNDQIFNFQNLLAFCYLLFVVCCLIVIFVYDLKHFLILDKVLIFATAVSLIFIITDLFLEKNFSNLWNLFFGSLIAGGFFLFLYLITDKKGIGVGDVKLGFLIGLWLPCPKILIALFFTFVLGGIVALVLLLTGRKKMKSQVPFGPFLAIGAFIALILGNQIINWYFKWLGL